MTKRTVIVGAGFLLCGLLLAGAALAMDSTHYRPDRFTPATGSGGAAGSSHYAVNLTVGQSAIGASNSASYGGCLGHWCGEFEHRIFLPLVLRNYS